MLDVKDVALLFVEEKPAFYVRIEDISPDFKKGWWHIEISGLTIPPQNFRWILDENQLDGAGFTMGGTPLRLEKFVSLFETEKLKKEADELKEIKEKNNDASPKPSKIVSLADRRKK